MFIVSHKQCLMLFQNQKQGHMTMCHKDANVTETLYCHRHVRTWTQLHDMYPFWHVVYRPYKQQPQSHSQGFTSLPPPPNVQQGITRHLVPPLHVDYWPCLASPTHSKIYLFPYRAIGNDASHSTSFACGLLALWAVTLPTHSRIYLHHAKWEALMWLVITKTGNHMSQRQGNHTSQRLGNHQ